MIWAYLRSLWIPGSKEQLLKSETALLQQVRAQVNIDDVAIEDGHSVHTIHATPGSSSGPTSLAPVVLLHGYFMGAASWSSSMSSITESGREVYAIDWPGSGCSTRPPLPPHGAGPNACEAYFVDKIEAWRQSQGLARMVLIGHSFGGYFAAAYSMKYPEHVESLVLASPVGMKEPNGPKWTDPDALAKRPWWQRTLFHTVAFMWRVGVTPQDLVRVAGPYGHRLVNKYVDARFKRPRANGLMELDGPVLSEYLYQQAAQPGGSERCLSRLLNVGAWAKQPIAPRMVEEFKVLEKGAPRTVLIYGEHDWMDVSAGCWFADELEHSMCDHKPEVVVVHDAGHQLSLDNPRAFNAALRYALGSGQSALGTLCTRLRPTKRNHS